MTINSTPTPSRLLKAVVVGQVLLVIGLIADLTSIFSSTWFTRLFNFNSVRWLSLILNFILTGVLIRLHRDALRTGASLRSDIENLADQNEQARRRGIGLWKRFIRTFRAIALQGVPKPAQRDALEPLLDELAKRLPGNGAHYKLAIARPTPDGSFRIIAERGMDPSSVFNIERMANWKEKRSFFANAFDLPEASKFAVYRTADTNYLDIQSPHGSGARPTSAGSHFIAAIKQPAYEDLAPRATLALVSVGIPKGAEIPHAELEGFYHEIYPVLKGIEGILLGYLISEKR